MEANMIYKNNDILGKFDMYIKEKRKLGTQDALRLVGIAERLKENYLDMNPPAGQNSEEPELILPRGFILSPQGAIPLYSELEVRTRLG
jgi:hypothetical protein